MFELETLLLGLEPITALTIGVGALLLAPAIGAVNSLTGNSISDSSRSAAKTGLIWVFEAFDHTQGAVAEAGESLQDLIAEAKSDRASQTKPKNGAMETPREVSIIPQ